MQPSVYHCGWIVSETVVIAEKLLAERWSVSWCEQQAPRWNVTRRKGRIAVHLSDRRTYAGLNQRPVLA